MISRRLLPFAGWLVALTFLISLIGGQITPGQVIGIARETTVAVSPLASGRLERLTVEQDQHVAAGEIIATLDDTAARIRLEAALLDIQTLRAKLDAERARNRLETSNRTLDVIALRRRLELDRLDARLIGIAEAGRRERDAADLRGTTFELERVSALAGDAIATRRLDQVTATHDALQARLRGRDALIHASEAAGEEATLRLAKLPYIEDVSPDPFVAPLEATIVAAEKRMELARLSKEEQVLRAPIDGVISTVLRRPGEVVGAGQPIVTITSPSATAVAAWVHEDQMKWVEIGREVQLRAASRPNALVSGSIVSRGASVLSVPEHALAERGVAEFGVQVLVQAAPDSALIPGERIAIRFSMPP